jgi:hypothetical protein
MATFKGHIMEHGPKAGQKIETLKDLSDYLTWQYEHGMITEKNRYDALVMARIEFPGEAEHTPSPWNNEEKLPKYGQSVSALVRDLLVSEHIMDYDEAVKFSNKFDELLLGADWLSLYDGTQYNKVFEPKRR